MARKCFISLHPNRIRNFDSLKNHFFLTDGIVVSDVDSFMHAHSSGPYARASVAKSLQYLLDNEIVKEAPSFNYGDLELLSTENDSFRSMLEDVDRVHFTREQVYDQMISGGQTHRADEHAKLNFEFEKIKEKLYAEYLTSVTGDVLSPIEKNYYQTGVLEQHNVVELVVNKFPVIDSNVDWQKIIELKQDDSSRLEHLRFREFTKKLANQNMSPIEVEEEIEFLIEEYKRHLSAANVKYRYGQRKNVFMTSLKFVENLISIKPSKTVESLYKFEENKFELLEAKESAPGKEIALLIKE